MTWLVLNGTSAYDLVLPDPLAASTNLTETLAGLRSDRVSVFTYPLTIELIRIQQLVGAFQFAIAGPPGVYSVFGSADFATWNEVGVTTNRLGKIVFTDTLAHLSELKFYRALLQRPPTNSVPDTLVFIPPNTFTMGSPTNEVGHSADEAPQTLVTFSNGFWISKYLVTQGDYLVITGTKIS
ncbi:MAG: hypothetical protein JWM99_2239 [Verrucomicrobiales bacterium]|nr:hypothetical protein [Verrucomicrobiales bacterium]